MIYLVGWLSLLLINGISEPAEQKNVSVAGVFGKTGLDLSPQIVERVQDLGQQIDAAHITQLQRAAELIVGKLEEQLKQVKQRISLLDRPGKRVPDQLFFEKYILEQRIDHFKNYFGLKEQTIGQWLAQKSEYVYHRARALLGVDISYQEQAEIIAKEMLDYFDIEKPILANYEKLLFFLELLKRYPIPHFMLVWDSPDQIENLKTRAKQLKPEVQVQLVETLISFAIQGLLMGGGGSALQFVDEQDKKDFDAAKAQQTEIETNWEQFQKKTVEEQKKIMTAITTAFTSSAQAIQNQYNKDQEQLSTESIYLAQTINQAKPREQFLAYPILSDIPFAVSQMTTPNPRLPWYNIYNIFQRGSDWQYNLTTNSFWQFGYASFPSQLFWAMKPEEADIAQNDPAAFAIFTEYVTDKNQYDIEVDCVLSTSTYPFFAGILFNRGRWISGSPERLWQYRLVGFYGNENKTIDIAFASEGIIPAKDPTPEKIVSPLETIVTKPESHIYSLPDAERAALEINPTTFTFKISTAPQSVNLVVSKIIVDAQKNQTIKPMVTKSVVNLKSLDFLFHGIGFIAIGCQAEFKIKQPIDLVYKPEQIIEFEKKKSA